MRRLLIILLLLLAGVAQAQSTEKTRLLLIMDCSNSMWDHWQSGSKIKVTQQVLLSFLDSISRQLRVFGHLNKEQFGTRLEVPFGSDNIYQLQSKIKTLVPQGGCTAAAALTDALSDFPATGSSRNLILIITDGMDDCDAEICDVARQVQLSGVVVQTFVLCIGGQLSAHASCAGSVFPVAHEEEFAKTLYDIFRLSGHKAKVVLNMVDGGGELYETEHPVAFYDHRTGVIRQSTIYSVDGKLKPDTLLLDPLVTYDMAVFTHPPDSAPRRQRRPRGGTGDGRDRAVPGRPLRRRGADPARDHLTRRRGAWQCRHRALGAHARHAGPQQAQGHYHRRHI